MKNNWIYVFCFVITIVISSLITHNISKPTINRKPFWHPFELNPNIDLKALVEDGYRCMSMPCGQAQFIKIIGDTIIQYDVSSIDCKSYDGIYFSLDEDIIELEENFSTESVSISKKSVEIIPKKGQDSLDKIYHLEYIESWKNKHNLNPYYPYNKKDIKHCYQGNYWRLYSIQMQQIDSIKIVNFISEKGGTMMNSFQNWNSINGGNFLVYHRKFDLYYICSIRKSYQNSWEKKSNWTFAINRSIPHLDLQKIKDETSRKEKIHKYYNSN